MSAEIIKLTKLSWSWLLRCSPFKRNLPSETLHPVAGHVTPIAACNKFFRQWTRANLNTIDLCQVKLCSKEGMKPLFISLLILEWNVYYFCRTSRTILYDESFLHASSSDDKFRKVAPDIQIWVSKNEVYSVAKSTVAATSWHQTQISILNVSIVVIQQILTYMTKLN